MKVLVRAFLESRPFSKTNCWFNAIKENGAYSDGTTTLEDLWNISTNATSNVIAVSHTSFTVDLEQPMSTEDFFEKYLYKLHPELLL